MAFAYLSEEGFEEGTIGHFDAQSPATFSRAFYYYFSELAAMPGMPAPWHGAYCFGVDLATNTTNHYIQETGSWDTSSPNTIWFRWMQWAGGPAFSMTDGDEFYTFQLWSSTNTIEVAAGIRYTTAEGYRFGVGASCLTHSTSQLLTFPLNRWHAVELGVVTGASTVSAIDLYIDGSHATQITGLTINTITSGVIGIIGQSPLTTTGGVVLWDDMIADDAQIYWPRERFPRTKTMTAPGHAFVGHGVIEDFTLLAGAATDCVVQLFDTDAGNVNDVSAVKGELKNTSNSESVAWHGQPIEFTRGCYVHMTGTNPRCVVNIGRAAGYWSDGKIRSFGARRTPRPGNV